MIVSEPWSCALGEARTLSILIRRFLCGHLGPPRIVPTSGAVLSVVNGRPESQEVVRPGGPSVGLSDRDVEGPGALSPSN
jgi:hypothetical protein